VSRDIQRSRVDLVHLAGPAQRESMEAYMRDQFVFLGVRTPERRRCTKQLLRDATGWEAGRIVGFVDECWAQPEREFQYVGADVVARHASRLHAVHLADLRRWITSRSWWDTVDTLAAHGVGTIVADHPEGGAEMDLWIDDQDRWVARSAILHQLRYKENTDGDRLFRYVLSRGTDTDFFIRKASGWALREYAKTAPDEVRQFVDLHERQLSALTRREALKNL
jgi:3-methyladenine DNA glycosylase AlkD